MDSGTGQRPAKIESWLKLSMRMKNLNGIRYHRTSMSKEMYDQFISGATMERINLKKKLGSQLGCSSGRQYRERTFMKKKKEK